MESQFDTLKCLGPLTAQAPIAAFCEFDERVWEIYRQLATQHGRITHGSREYLVIRMMYIAELTSNAIRMNATWALTPPAMSLLRDRYEQTVRFSWLVRNPDQNEYVKYERAMLDTITAIVRKIDPKTIETEAAARGQPFPTWATTLTKEQRAKNREWSAMQLETMAKKRDAFSPMTDTPLAKEGLAQWYGALYTQFSAVTHYNRLSIEMVQPEQNPEGTHSLSMNAHWPGLLIHKTGWLDMIQCSEACKVGLGQDATIKFESLFLEWLTLSKQLQAA
jgi:hypothetical protein